MIAAEHHLRVIRLTAAKALKGGQCFLRGTKIQTVEGERRIEDLAVGDLLPTALGGERPIQWTVRFRRTKVDAGKPWQNHARPVRIMKSTLAPNVPQADLFLTPGYALLLDKVLVTTGSLINGTTILPHAADEYDELDFVQIKREPDQRVTGVTPGLGCSATKDTQMFGSAGLCRMRYR